MSNTIVVVLALLLFEGATGKTVPAAEPVGVCLLAAIILDSVRACVWFYRIGNVKEPKTP